MGRTRTEIYTGEHQFIASLAKGLAHPARIAILKYISCHDDCICNDLVKEIGLSQPTITQHLMELKATGIINGRNKGNSIFYCIDQEALAKFHSTFNILFHQLISDND